MTVSNKIFGSRFVFFLLYVFFCCNTCYAETKYDCTKNSLNSICIKYEQTKGRIVFYAKNSKSMSETVTFDLPEFVNMSADKAVPLTVVCPPKSETQLVTLVSDKNNSWKYTYKYWVTRGNAEAVHDDRQLYSLPFKSGETYSVIQGYGGFFSHKDENFYALDFDMPVGSAVCASRDGIVVDLKNDSDISGSSKEYADDGNYIVIEHSDKTLGEYWHLKKNGTFVDIGQVVKAGMPIGLSGNTGFSSGPHLHFAVTSPVNGQSFKSYKTRFMTSSGIVDELIEGQRYSAK